MILVAFVANAGAAQDKTTMQAEYDTGIARLRRADATVDIRRLRHLWAGLPGYDPYAEGKNRDATVAAVKRDDAKEALRLARLDLEADYLDIDAHMAAMVANRMAGDEKASEQNRAVVVGILKSITEFGDGDSPSTAYVVVTVREEYAVLRAFGMQMKSQELLTGPEHSFDVMTVIDPATKKETVIYFNIDLLMAHQKKLFAPEPEKPKDGVLSGMPASVPAWVPESAPGRVAGGGADTASAGTPRGRLEAEAADDVRPDEGGVLAGRARVRTQPEYPESARTAGIEGTVVVEIVVSETGAITSARVISGHPLLRDAALEAAKSWVFDPTLLEGIPVKVLGKISFNFNLE